MVPKCYLTWMLSYLDNLQSLMAHQPLLQSTEICKKKNERTEL